MIYKSNLKIEEGNQIQLIDINQSNWTAPGPGLACFNLGNGIQICNKGTPLYATSYSSSRSITAEYISIVNETFSTNGLVKWFMPLESSKISNLDFSNSSIVCNASWSSSAGYTIQKSGIVICPCYLNNVYINHLHFIEVKQGDYVYQPQFDRSAYSITVKNCLFVPYK